jgi:hypothetical protein
MNSEALRRLLLQRRTLNRVDALTGTELYEHIVVGRTLKRAEVFRLLAEHVFQARRADHLRFGTGYPPPPFSVRLVRVR